MLMTDALSSPRIPVLGKRKLRNCLPSPQHHDRRGNLVLNTSFLTADTSSDDEYSSSAEDEYETTADGSESELESENEMLEQHSTRQTSRAASRVPSSSRLKDSSRKTYICSYDDCSKSYTKPCRLVEHDRSHTGQRPFQCGQCAKSYRRENHLQAHSRTHLPASDRPFVCSFEVPTSLKLKAACDKRFWTKQHLNAHLSAVHQGVKPYSCESHDCTERFAKHHQARAHFAAAHCSSGTKPFRCTHEGCTKSFSTAQKLRTHSKVHQSNRYACSLESCRTEVPGTSARAVQYFSTWSELQRHIRNDHPPACPQPECDGQTFATRKALRAHMRTHEQDYASAEDSLPNKKARRGGEFGRDWACSVEGCDLDFKSKKALTNHVNITHNGLRTFACPEPGCTLVFGYKHVMQRHLARKHPRQQTPKAPAEEPIESEKDVEAPHEGPSLLDLFTGKHYTQPSSGTRKNIQRSIKCPWPHIAQSDTALPSPAEFTSTCDFAFSRTYDLHRHLRAEHGLEVNQDVLDALELRGTG